jgi:hypothetical protein
LNYECRGGYRIRKRINSVIHFGIWDRIIDLTYGNVIEFHEGGKEMVIRMNKNLSCYTMLDDVLGAINYLV